LSTAAWNY